MKHVDIYLAADTSFYDTHPKDRFLGYMLEFNGRAVVGAIRVLGAYGNEAALMGMLVALNRLSEGVEVVVHANSTYLESQINTGNIYLWMDRKGLKSNMRPIRYKDTWMETLDAIQKRCPDRIKSSRDVPPDKLAKLKDVIEELKVLREPINTGRDEKLT